MKTKRKKEKKYINRERRKKLWPLIRSHRRRVVWSICLESKKKNAASLNFDEKTQLHCFQSPLKIFAGKNQNHKLDIELVNSTFLQVLYWSPLRLSFFLRNVCEIRIRCQKAHASQPRVICYDAEQSIDLFLYSSFGFSLFRSGFIVNLWVNKKVGDLNCFRQS